LKLASASTFKLVISVSSDPSTNVYVVLGESCNIFVCDLSFLDTIISNPLSLFSFFYSTQSCICCLWIHVGYVLCRLDW
jgi:hypothetical protein